MPELPPTESVTLKCDGDEVPVIFRIRLAGPARVDIPMPCGVLAVTSVSVSRGGYGVAITIDADSSGGAGGVPAQH